MNDIISYKFPADAKDGGVALTLEERKKYKIKKRNTWKKQNKTKKHGNECRVNPGCIRT